MITQSRDLRAARNQALVAIADAGAAPAQLRLYSAQGGDLLAVRKFAKPCGTITSAGRISLEPSEDNDTVLMTGEPTWAELHDGSGAFVLGGAVTNESGAGPFKLKGADTMLIYEGGLVLLALPALLG